MHVKPALLFWLWRQTLPATLPALAIALPYVLFRPEPFVWRVPNAWLFIFIHSLAAVALLGQPGSGRLAFLYTRGYSRSTLWAHMLLGSVAAVLTVWLPAALLIWLGARSAVQDQIFQSPYFPFLYASELVVPLAWLAGYALLLSMLHYVWVRRAVPWCGRGGAIALALGLAPVAFTLIAMGFHASWFAWLTVLALAAAVVALVVGGWRLHERLEVRA